MIIGKKVVHYSELDSTNVEARRLIKKGEGEGLVVIAGRQSKGQGKPGSRWESPAGNLYLSAVIKPYRNPRELAPITLLGALAGRAALQGLAGLSAVIKWPNDLLVRGRKIGGVLTERLPSGHLIIGIGINLNVIPAAVRKTATSLRAETGQKSAPEKFAGALISALDLEYRSFMQRS